VVGVTTPEKFFFDKVHEVPAARQMLEPVMPAPMLNPMHPPLAKQLMALSIRTFGDVPLGWRYPSVLFGSLAIVAMYLCGFALFTAQGPAVASALLAFSTRWCSCSRGSRCWIFSRWHSACWRSQRSFAGFRKQRPQLWFALAGLAFGLSIACKWSGLFALAICIVIVTVIRLMQGWRIQFANGNADDWYRPGKARVGVAESALYAPGARLRCSIPIRSGSICF
jgi:dolichyl-phosphate-mannose-protein mannosyltransferase